MAITHSPILRLEYDNEKNRCFRRGGDPAGVERLRALSEEFALTEHMEAELWRLVRERYMGREKGENGRRLWKFADEEVVRVIRMILKWSWEHDHEDAQRGGRTPKAKIYHNFNMRHAWDSKATARETLQTFLLGLPSRSQRTLLSALASDATHSSPDAIAAFSDYGAQEDFEAELVSTIKDRVNEGKELRVPVIEGSERLEQADVRVVAVLRGAEAEIEYARMECGHLVPSEAPGEMAAMVGKVYIVDKNQYVAPLLVLSNGCELEEAPCSSSWCLISSEDFV